jgi:ferredoxin-NADP reductase/Na+-translocating ferredoxin:NAD+ oxidoreductase RnfD subunit
MLNFTDNILNRITMYRVVLYYLIFILAGALVLSLFGVLSYSPLALIFSVSFITIICLVTNIIFAWAFKAPTNSESVYITALILALIITPLSSPKDFGFFIFTFWASVLAIASKYILAIKNKHVFNPAAIAVVLTAIFLDQFASWWVGATVLFPFILIGGLLMTRKLLRADLVISFLIVVIPLSVYSHITNGVSFFESLWIVIAGSHFLFLAFVMLTEPLTTPPTRIKRIIYGVIVGFLAWPDLHLGALFFTPALALVLANVFSYLVSPKEKLLLTLKEKIAYGKDIYHFVFSTDQELIFAPGQYLEWTLDKGQADSRGNRRYFTIASAPTEKEIGLGVKFNPESSTFKKHLLDMKKGDKIVTSQLAGEFILPKDKNHKLVFIAGGIGITPFRSILKYLVDKKEKRDIVQFYSNKFSTEIAYKDVFDRAEKELRIKTIYSITDKSDQAYTGRITEDLIKKDVPDYLERYFYLSGPHNLVTAFEATLKELGVKRSQIKTDFFPGFV